jgi:isopenicillin N synthase-like dioxygenase
MSAGALVGRDLTSAEHTLREFRERGFAAVTFSAAEVQGIDDLVRRFYAMSLSARLQAAAFSTSGVLGYYPSEHEAAAVRQQHGIIVPTFEGKRARGYCSFDYLVNDQNFRTSALLRENRWPGDQSFRSDACAVYAMLSARVKGLSAAILAELDNIGRLECIPKNAFECDCCSIMRLLKYAKQDEERESKPHTDYEFMSLILADGEGLEVFGPDGTWRMPPHDTGGAVLLPGDMLEVATGGWVRSALHRVRFGKAERYSVIFFQGLGLNQEIVYSVDGNPVTSTFGAHLSAMLVRGAAHLAASLDEWEQTLGVKIPQKNPFRLSKEGPL